MYLLVNLLIKLLMFQGAQGLAHPGNLLAPPWVAGSPGYEPLVHSIKTLP